MYDEDLLRALVGRTVPVDRETWHAFFNRLLARKLRRGEAAAVLTSLSTLMPDNDTLGNLLDCLDERRPMPEVGFAGAVNIVGTGGGPRTFNLSTAAALVAAAMGVRVVKTGSRGYTSRYGSVDMLDRLGIRLTASYQESAESLERFGLAFAGPFVYPGEIALLAKEILPLDLRVIGRFVNSVGPFLAAMPVSAQLTGVSDPALLPSLRFLAARRSERRVWLCHNDLGVDELIGFGNNLIETEDGGIALPAGAQTSTGGSLADLAGADGDPVEQFRDVLGGRANDTAVEAVCLNATALSVLGGAYDDWTKAMRVAEETIRGGAALDLVNRMRSARAANLLAAGHA
jgi:anthranilate phosphoribosyltransferase